MSTPGALETVRQPPVWLARRRVSSREAVKHYAEDCIPFTRMTCYTTTATQRDLSFVWFLFCAWERFPGYSWYREMETAPMESDAADALTRESSHFRIHYRPNTYAEQNLATIITQ